IEALRGCPSSDAFRIRKVEDVHPELVHAIDEARRHLADLLLELLPGHAALLNLAGSDQTSRALYGILEREGGEEEEADAHDAEEQHEERPGHECELDGRRPRSIATPAPWQRLAVARK